MPEAIKLEQAKKENAALVKTLYFVIGLGVIAISWYMVTLNITQKETNVILGVLKVQNEKLAGAFDQLKDTQISQTSEDKSQSLRINSIEKEQELLKLKVLTHAETIKGHSETLKKQEVLIRDKRRCVGCEQ